VARRGFILVAVFEDVEALRAGAVESGEVLEAHGAVADRAAARGHARVPGRGRRVEARACGRGRGCGSEPSCRDHQRAEGALRPNYDHVSSLGWVKVPFQKLLRSAHWRSLTARVTSMNRTETTPPRGP